MYGMIHRAARQMVLHQFGSGAWESVTAAAQVSDDHFMSGAAYDDAITNAIISAISSVTGIGGSDVLRAFGRYWIIFAGESAFSSVMDMAGDDLPGFVLNLNRMHGAVQASLPDAIMPEFELVHVEEGRLSVRYISDRQGLAPFVAGLFEGLFVRFKLDGQVVWQDVEGVPTFDVSYRQTVIA